MAALKLQWQDPFSLEEQLTAEERMAMDTARQYSQEKLLPRIVKAYQSEQCVGRWALLFGCPHPRLPSASTAPRGRL